MSHLGDRAAAFVDGQLTPEAAERATAHLASCRPCRDLVELERLTKVRLASLRGPAPAPDLVTRLLAMGGPAGPLPPRPGHVPGTPRPQPVPLRAAAPVSVSAGTLPLAAVRPAGRTPSRRPAGRPARRPAALTRRRTRLAAAVLGALSVVGVGVAGVSAGGLASGAAPGPLTPRVGTVSAPVGASVLTTSLSGSVTSFDWLGTSGNTRSDQSQGLVVRR